MFPSPLFPFPPPSVADTNRDWPSISPELEQSNLPIQVLELFLKALPCSRPKLQPVKSLPFGALTVVLTGQDSRLLASPLSEARASRQGHLSACPSRRGTDYSSPSLVTCRMFMYFGPRGSAGPPPGGADRPGTHLAAVRSWAGET